MLKKNKFIVIEGIDGSGKTTVCKLLSQKINGLFYKTPSLPFSDFREDIDRYVNIQSRFYFYLSSVIHASSEIDNLLNQNHVVCDRYILSTLCYHRAADSSFYSFNEQNIDILRPDYTFYLDAEYEIRMKRVVKREQINYEEAITTKLHNKNYQEKVKLEFLKYNNLIKLDTSNVSADNVTETIINRIKECL